MIEEKESFGAKQRKYFTGIESNKLLGNFNTEDIEKLIKYLEFISFPEDTVIVREGYHDTDMYFILKGKASLFRSGMDLGRLCENDYFGELALIDGRSRSATITALSNFELAKLSGEKLESMIKLSPEIAIKLIRAMVGKLGIQLTEITDSIGHLLFQRSLPRSLTVNVKINEIEEWVKTGTRIDSLLPVKIGESNVVAALMNNKAVSLSTPVTYSCEIKPLTSQNWEGEKIYRHSAALMVLEAAKEIGVLNSIKLGISLGNVQWIEIINPENVDPKKLVNLLSSKVKDLIQRNLPFREEWWFIEEAADYFKMNGFNEASSLLHHKREMTVPMVTCGQVYALSFGPLISSTGLINNFELTSNESELILSVGDSNQIIRQLTPNYSQVMNEPSKWLNSLGLTSVGKYNQFCIDDDVSKIIHVAEGFHEKRISLIADTIANKKKKIKIICIAGPSSSGKTTFIKRLTVQLQVNGINPVNISFDDYYLDREYILKDETGENDYESLTAFNLKLLREHFTKLINGESIKTPRYNFSTGKCMVEAGEKISIEKDNVLLIEGIHCLNPVLFDSIIPEPEIFRIFIQPMTSIPLDHLIRVNPSDLRLLRRIVRDRYQRGFSPEDNIMRWESVRKGERDHIFPFINQADAIFDTSLIYEISVLKVYAERYLLEVAENHPAFTTAFRLRQLIDNFIAIYPEHVPPTSILREFIGNSGFKY